MKVKVKDLICGVLGATLYNIFLSSQKMAAQLWPKGEVVIGDIFRSSLKSSQLSAVFGGAKKQFKGKIRSVLPWKFGFRRH